MKEQPCVRPTYGAQLDNPAINFLPRDLAASIKADRRSIWPTTTLLPARQPRVLGQPRVRPARPTRLSRSPTTKTPSKINLTSISSSLPAQSKYRNPMTPTTNPTTQTTQAQTRISSPPPSPPWSPHTRARAGRRASRPAWCARWSSSRGAGRRRRRGLWRLLRGTN